MTAVQDVTVPGWGDLKPHPEHDVELPLPAFTPLKRYCRAARATMPRHASTLAALLTDEPCAGPCWAPRMVGERYCPAHVVADLEHLVRPSPVWWANFSPFDTRPGSGDPLPLSGRAQSTTNERTS